MTEPDLTLALVAFVSGALAWPLAATLIQHIRRLVRHRRRRNEDTLADI